jgi:hypothetical protein
LMEKGAIETYKCIGRFAIVRDLSKMSSLSGGVSSSSRKGKKLSKVPRVDKTSQSIRTSTKSSTDPLHVLGKLLQLKLIQEKQDLDQSTSKR